MGKHETYWNGLEQYNANPEFLEKQKDEFRDEASMVDALSDDSLDSKSSRRDFLKIFGFGLTAAALTACVEKPVRKAIPFVNKPENVTPGKASWYSSTCNGCAASCGVLVKSREGRPIKIEGNDRHMLSKGGTCPVGQGTVLNLYDSHRLKKSRGPGGPMDWDAVNGGLGGKLAKLGAGAKVLLISNTITSPSSHKVIEKFKQKYPNSEHVTYDPVSNYALAKVHSTGRHRMIVPAFNFAKADVIVSFDADFLGSWISPVEFTKDYIKNRKLDPKHPKMSSHIQFESRVSLTGSNADLRIPMKASQMYGGIATLYNKVVGGGSVSNPNFDGPGNGISRAADQLKKADRGRSLVISGINDPAVQAVVKAINEHLGNYGSTLDADFPSYQAQGNDEKMSRAIQTMASAQAVIFLDDANPVYDHAQGTKIAEALEKVALSISFNAKENETSEKCKYAIAQTHYLESWSDANPRKMHYSIQQPLVRPIFGSKPWQDVILTWSGESNTYFEFVKQVWSTEIFAMQGSVLLFNDFWNKAVQDGYFMAPGRGGGVDVVEAHDVHVDNGDEGNDEEMGADVVADLVPDPVAVDLGDAGRKLKAYFDSNKDKMEAVIYQTGHIRDGRWANNPWLQEMPDPITKVTWDNYISVPYAGATAKGWRDGMMMVLKVGENSVELPIVLQPGQALNTMAVQLGYGRGDVAGRVAKGIGKSAYPLMGIADGTVRYNVGGASLSAGTGSMEMAKSQTYINYKMVEEGGDSKRKLVEGRLDDFIVKETTLDEYKHNKASGNKRPSAHHMISLWDVHDKKGHHWAMSIDLNSCTGCGSCIVSCHAENNVAMVGKQEVLNRREMHWMRLDRYFKGDPADQEGNLKTVHQPMLCQHCDNAPCETVCPVLATVHSDEGLNQQVYNRCIGTRYCANNCPYKVRRFNWFSYYWNDDFKDVNSIQRDPIGRMVLNPDVTVRARGVMEKCSFCVQRIQEKKLNAKVEKRKLKDGEIKTACQQSCPADAIVFGDLNDEKSEIHKLYFNKRGYHALEDIKVLPSVLYMTKVRNPVPGGKKASTEVTTDAGAHS